MKKFLIAAILASPLVAQFSQPTTYVSTDPSGSCTVGSALEYNIVNGDLSGCKAGTWAVIAAGSGSGVSSFNARTGVVVPTTGDYTAAQVTNAVSTTGSYSNPAWITALSATILTSFSVTNDTNVTGSFSAGTFALGWTGTLAKARMFSTTVYNDQSNTFGAHYQDYHSASFRLPETVVGSLPAASSQTGLVYVVTDGVSTSDCVTGGSSYRALCNSNGTAWVPLGGSGGGGGGITAAYQLTDFQVTKTSGTVETINAAASSTAPITSAVKDVSYPFVASSTLTISGTSSTGSVYWCALKDGTLSAYSALAATLTPSSGLSSNFGSSCPADSRTLWATTMTNNTWDAITEGMDKRASQQTVPAVQPGSFMTNSFSGNVESIALDTTKLTGNGPNIVSSTGSTPSGDYVKWDANGNAIDGGTGTSGITPGTCITGSGTVTTVNVNVSGTTPGCAPTVAQIQAGQPIALTTTSSSGTTYTATGNPTYSAYTQDARYTWDVGGTACTAGAVTLNLDGLGAKSVFEADGSTNPVANDCTAHRVVELAYDSSGHFRIVGGGQIGGGGGGCSTCIAPFTQTTFHEVDDFVPAQYYGIGKLGWQAVAVSGSGYAGFLKAYAGHPGVAGVYTNGTTAGDTTVMNLNSSQTGGLAWLYLGTTAAVTNWEVQFTIITDDNSNSVAGTALELGFMDSNSYRTGNSISVRYDTTSVSCSSGTNSNTDWMLEVFASGTSTCVDTGVSVSAATWYTFLLTSTSLGTVNLTVATNGGTPSSPVTASSNVPTAPMWPTFLVQTHQTTDHRIGVDYWEFLATGLTR